jgi:hypothetical protein
MEGVTDAIGEVEGGSHDICEMLDGAVEGGGGLQDVSAEEVGTPLLPEEVLAATVEGVA